MKIGDIKGESQAAGHKDWIIIESIADGGIEIERDAATGLPTGKRQHRPFTVIKPLDKATPLLMDSLTRGTPLENVTFEAAEPYPVPGSGESREVSYYRYRMKDAVVVSYQVCNDGDPDRPVTEEVSFEFPYAEWHVRQLAEDGSIVDTAGAYFDMELNEAGPANNAPVIGQVGNVSAAAGETVEVDIRIEDFDTLQDDLIINTETDPAAVKVGPVKWMAPEMLRLSLTTTTTADGQSPVTLRVSDGQNTASMSFSLFIDSSGTPWDGFMMAYFTEEERADPNIASPIEDPDGDNLDTLLEFLLGTNPREYTPIEIRSTTGGGGGGGRIAVWPDYLDPDDDGDGIDVEFDRRIDDPRIRLSLLASFDGGESWQELQPGSGDNPLYEENANKGENPLYEGVNGSVNPPDEATAVMIRFVGTME
jgi:type VI secretion system secreted protein Hcp